jgi:hypothetical protein
MERLTLTQNGNTVNGTVNFTAAMNSSAQVNGTVTGTVNGDTLTNVTATLNSCSYQGTLIASGNAPSTTLTGNLTPVSMGTCGSSAPVQVLVTKPN